MTKIIKYIIGIVSVTIILLLIIPFFISLDTYKETIALQVKKHTGRDLKIEGNISLDIIPAPQIKLSQLKLSSLPQAKTKNFLEIDMVSGKLDLFSLLKGEIVISSIELIKPVINLEKLKNGKGTWEFQTAKIEDKTAPVIESKESSTNKLPLIINDIKIQKGTLNYIDKDSKNRIEDFDLNVTIKDIYHPTATSNSGSKQGAVGRWSQEKIDLSALSIANGSISFKAKKITNGKLTLDNIAMKSELDEGILKIKSFVLGLYGGKFEAAGSISGKTGQPITFKLALKDARIHDIVPEGGKIKITNGSINIACNINSHGSSQLDYVKNINGNISLRGKDGKVSGIDLEKLINALNKPRDIGALANGLGASIGKGNTAFNSIQSDISIEKGIMNITKCELISGETSAISVGKINLPSFNLDVLTTINSGIKNFPPITIHFYGPIDNPQNKIDVKAIWQYLLNNALTGVINNLKQGKIKPQDLLKGILEVEDKGISNAEDENEYPQDAANKLLEKGLKGLFK